MKELSPLEIRIVVIMWDFRNKCPADGSATKWVKQIAQAVLSNLSKQTPEEMVEMVAHRICRFSYSEDSCTTCKSGSRGACPDNADIIAKRILSQIQPIITQKELEAEKRGAEMERERISKIIKDMEQNRHRKCLRYIWVDELLEALTERE